MRSGAIRQDASFFQSEVKSLELRLKYETLDEKTREYYENLLRGAKAHLAEFQSRQVS